MYLVLSDDDAEDTPVPIPNTVVKLRGADDTWRAPALQAGGHGFESHHLHQKLESFTKMAKRWKRYIGKLNGLIAQQVRARA